MFLCILLLFNFMISIFEKKKKCFWFFCLKCKRTAWQLHNFSLYSFILCVLESRFSRFSPLIPNASSMVPVQWKSLHIVHWRIEWKKPNKATDNWLSYETNEKTEKSDAQQFLYFICILNFHSSFRSHRMGSRVRQKTYNIIIIIIIIIIIECIDPFLNGLRSRLRIYGPFSIEFCFFLT